LLKDTFEDITTKGGKMKEQKCLNNNGKKIDLNY
jgi:hypothetical protein